MAFVIVVVSATERALATWARRGVIFEDALRKEYEAGEAQRAQEVELDGKKAARRREEVLAALEADIAARFRRHGKSPPPAKQAAVNQTIANTAINSSSVIA